jgi:CRISPR/Cas system-associated exonuclease Cas4 (RecB family)/rubrerythrin
MRPSALRRLKATYKGDDRVLPHLERHVMRAMGQAESTRRHDVMHPSEMSHKDWCGRHDYYRIIGTPSEKEAMANPSFTMSNIFAEGHQIHGKYQDWFWEMDVLHGYWLCLSCQEYWEDTAPRQCRSCGSPRLMYREVPLNRELVGGHADGAVHDLNKWDGLIEIKSIGIGTIRHEAPRMYQRYLDGETLENVWWKIQRPFTTHIKQGQLYLWMAWPRYEEICFIYESKFHQQVKEFVVSYNPTLIAPVLEIAREVTRAVAQGSPPARPEWAEDSDSKICKSCPYRGTCWQLGAPVHDSTQAHDPTPNVRVLKASPAKRRRAIRSA